MSHTADNWIQLDRRFLPMATTPDMSQMLTALGRGETWDDILRHSCVVVLGEAGTGKTTELRRRAADLVQNGGVAFFLPIEKLAITGVANSLGLQDTRRLGDWLTATDSDAWFMLDSVDEAALHGKMLSTALIAFAKELEPNLHRVHVIVSSRPSDWRSADEDDVSELGKHLATARRGDPFALKLLQLAPLDQKQVAALAEHYEVGDLDAFLCAVRDSNAWSFLERPQDVQWLVRYWVANKRLGHLAELVSFNIDGRLRENDRRQTILSVERARQGARVLALAACLTETFEFCLPDTADPRAQHALDPCDFLKDWTTAELRDLLARGLFDEATYGRVRIHHRVVQEFLAAEQLTDMLTQGLPRADLDVLLFRQSAGKVVVPRTLSAVVAWLASTDQEVRRQAVRCIPEHLIDEGDPSSLPADARRTTLRAYAERFADRERVYHHFDPFGLQRFASPELADDIGELLADPETPQHLLATLLTILERGAVTSLADAALTIALGPATPPYVRTHAVRATGVVGSPTQLAELATLATRIPRTDRELLATLLDVLFPEYLPPSSLVPLVAVADPSSPTSVTLLDVVLPRLPARCTRAERAQLLFDLTIHMSEPTSVHPTPSSVVTPRRDRIWLAEWLVSLVASVVVDGPPFPDVLCDAIDLVQGIQTHPDARIHPRSDSIIGVHPELRRQIFWRDVARATSGGKPLRSRWQLPSYSVFALSDKDVSWLSEDCIQRRDVHDRLLVFDCLVGALERSQPSGEEQLATLTTVAAASDSANNDGVLSTRLHRLTNQPYIPPHHSLLEMARRDRAREIRQRKLNRENHEGLRAVLPALRAGTHWNALVHLHGVASFDGDNRETSWKTLADTYDGDIASAALAGFRCFWRNHDPLPREKGEINSIPFASEVALVGLDEDARHGVILHTLPQPLLRKAAANAAWTLNGFPKWFPSFAEACPDIVRSTFEPSIRLDYDSQPGDGTPNLGRLLYKLQDASAEIRRACAPTLTALLLDHNPPDPAMLVRVLDTLHDSCTLDSDDFLALAKSRAANSTGDYPLFAVWWCCWLRREPDEAITFLEDALSKATVSKALCEEVFARLWTLHGDRGRAGGTSLPLNLRTLTRLIPFVHRHVRRQDDVTHDSVFSPGKRDDSQDLRDSLITWLARIEGPDTVDALERLAIDPELSHERDWLLHLADTRATEDASSLRMSTRNAVTFIRSLVRDPVTTEELFAVALARLTEIQDNLTHGDFSQRATFNPPKTPIQEEHVQNYFAEELNHRRRKQYTVAREPEVKRRAKPDIRLDNPRCNGPVTLELKIAERWTFQDLEEALRTQLVGTYLRANNSRFGVLVVCSSGPAKTWVVPDLPHNLSFHDVIKRLQNLAAEIKEADPQVLDLRVVGIDFH